MKTSLNFQKNIYFKKISKWEFCKIESGDLISLSFGPRCCPLVDGGVGLENLVFLSWRPPSSSIFRPRRSSFIYLSADGKKNKSLNLPLKTKNKTELLLRGGDTWAICLVSLATAQSRLHKVHKPTLTKHAYLSGKGWSWLDIRVNWRKFLKKWRSAE